VTTAPTVKGTGTRPASVSFSPSGSHAYVVDENGFIDVISTSSRKVSHVISDESHLGEYGQNFGGALSASGKSLYVSTDVSGAAQLLRYSTSTRKFVQSYTLTPGPNNAVWLSGKVTLSADGDFAYIWNTAGGVGETDSYISLFKLNLRTGESTDYHLQLIDDSYVVAQSVVLTGNGADAWVSTNTGCDCDTTGWIRSFVEVDTSNGNIVRTVTTSGVPGAFALSSNGTTLYVPESVPNGINTDGSIETVNTSTGAITPFATKAGAGFQGAALTPNGKRLVVTGTSMTYIYSTADGSLISSSLADGNAPAVASSPNGEYAYVESEYTGTSIVTMVKSKAEIGSHVPRLARLALATARSIRPTDTRRRRIR
jgi:hypothetical protein